MNKSKMSASEALMIIFDTLKFLKARNNLSGHLSYEDFHHLQSLFPRNLIHQNSSSVVALNELENVLRSSFQTEIAWELNQFIAQIRVEIEIMNSLQSIQFPAAGSRALLNSTLQQAA